MTSEPLILSLGWTLLHSLWQLGVIALVLYALLRLLSGYRAESRYLLACTALALCLLAPLATFSYLYQPVAAPQTPSPPLQETVAENQAASAVPTATGQSPASPRPPQSAAESPAITSPATPVTVPQPQLAPLQRLLPYLVIFWLFGVTLLSLKLCLDLIYVSRVRRRSAPVSGGLMQHLESLKRRIGISRTVSLLQTKLCDSPSVIGIFRPVVLLPVSVMTGLSEEQLTAILLHELAHIRRHDYLINLLQSIIETLLFYHPAVWWVSGQIRAEREYACDDMVVRLGSHPVSYARALAELESLRHNPKLAIAASHTNLTERVKRLLGAPQLTPMRGLAGVMILTVLAIMSLLVFPTAAQMDESEAITEDTGRLIFVTVTDNVVFSDDFRALERFVRNLGYLIVEDRQADQIRKVVVTPLETGELVYDYQINGRSATFDTDAEQWFQEALDFAILSSLRLRGRRTPGLPPTLTGTRERLQTSFIVASQLSPLDAPVMRRSFSESRIPLQAPVDGFERTVYFGILNVIHSRSHRLMDDDDLRDTLLTILDHPQAHSLDLALLRKAADEFDNQDFRADILQRISDLEQQSSANEDSNRLILITATDSVIFSEDLQSFEGFTNNRGYLVLEDRQDNQVRKVVVSPLESGELTYDYHVNGQAATFDAEAKDWFKEALDDGALSSWRSMEKFYGVPARATVYGLTFWSSFLLTSHLLPIDAAVLPNGFRNSYDFLHSYYSRLDRVGISYILSAIHSRAHQLMNDDEFRLALMMILHHSEADILPDRAFTFLRRAADEFENQVFRDDIMQQVSALEQRRVAPEDSDRRIFVTATDGVIYDKNYTTLERLTRENDYLLLEDRQPGHFQTLRVTANSEVLSYDYQVNGEAAIFDEAAQQWFAEALDYVLLERFRSYDTLPPGTIPGSYSRVTPVITSYFNTVAVDSWRTDFHGQFALGAVIELDNRDNLHHQLVRAMHARAHQHITDYVLHTALRNILEHPSAAEFDVKTLRLIRLAAAELRTYDFSQDIHPRIEALEQELRQQG